MPLKSVSHRKRNKMTEEILKDKDQTMSKLLMAFDKILVEEGFQSLGINKIAKTAGVSKVLIYRYFADFDGLLAAYLEQKAFWLTEGQTDIVAIKQLNAQQVRQLAIQLFHNLLDSLVESTEQQEIRRWELMEYNQVIDAIGKKIEDPSKQRNKAMAEILGVDEDDVAGVIAILIGGIYYLILRAKTTDLFNAVELRTPEGRTVIKNAISLVINNLIK